MSKVKKSILSIILVLILVITILGISYAYFTANLSGVENVSSIKMTGGRMIITYSNNSNSIVVQNIYPRSTEWVTKEFALTGTNTTDIAMGYKLYLTIDSNSFSNNALSLSLTGGSLTANQNLINVSQLAIPNTIGDLALGTSAFNNADGVIHNYILKIFYKEGNSNQNVDQEKVFTGHITVKTDEEE